MKKLSQFGICGRAKQMRVFTVPAYVDSEGNKRDRELVIFDSIQITKRNNVIIRGFVQKGNSFFPRSLRVDHMRRVPMVINGRRCNRYFIDARQTLKNKFKEL